MDAGPALLPAGGLATRGAERDAAPTLTSAPVNRPALRLAREIGLPLLGTSDSHLARQFGTTYSLISQIDGEARVASVLTAVRKGQVQIVTRPLTLRECAGIVLRLMAGSHRERAKKGLRRAVRPAALVSCGGEPAGKKIIGEWQDASADKTLEFFEDGRAVATVALDRPLKEYPLEEGRLVGSRTEGDLHKFADPGSLSNDLPEHAVVSLDREYSEYAFIDHTRIKIRDVPTGRITVLHVVALTNDTLELRPQEPSVIAGLWAGRYRRAGVR